jgi:hypothetical protein
MQDATVRLNREEAFPEVTKIFAVIIAQMPAQRGRTNVRAGIRVVSNSQ